MARTKYATIKEPLFIVDIYTKDGRYGELIEIEFGGVKTQHLYRTWIDPTYLNFKNWAQIIEAYNNGYTGIIVDKLKYKDQEKRLVNADSKPYIVRQTDESTLACELVDFHMRNRGPVFDLIQEL